MKTLRKAILWRLIIVAKIVLSSQVVRELWLMTCAAQKTITALTPYQLRYQARTRINQLAWHDPHS